MHFAPTQEAIAAHGDPPRKPGNPRRLDYLLLRNEGDAARSRFVNVLEPFKGSARVHGIEVLAQTEEAIELAVTHDDGVDTIRHSVDRSGTSLHFTRRDTAGTVTKAWMTGSGSLALGDGSIDIEGPVFGTVHSVDPEAFTVDVERGRNSLPLKPSALKGETVHFGNDTRSAAYTIEGVEREGKRCRIDLGGESIRIGRFVVTGVNADGTTLSTKTNLYLANQGYYRGAWLTNHDHTVWLPIDDVVMSPHIPKVRRDCQIRLVGSHDLSPFQVDDIAYIYDVGPGDTYRITPQVLAVRRDDGTLRVKSNCRVSVPGD